MKVLFCGSPAFALPSLKALERHDIIGVFTQPPKPKGRGYQETKTPIHMYAEQRGYPLWTPTTLRGSEDIFAEADIAVVVAYGLLLPKSILDAPKKGCVNVHASLLPRWRGAAPIHRALMAGDTETGITLMEMDEGLDTGPMILKKSITITPHHTIQSLHDELSELGAETLEEGLVPYTEGRLLAQPQPSEGVTYATKLSRADSTLDWSLPAVSLERHIRACTPWPGVWVRLGEHNIKITAGEIVPGKGSHPGLLIDDLLTLSTGQEALRVTRLIPEGKGEMTAEDFLRGHPLTPGLSLCPATNLR